MADDHSVVREGLRRVIEAEAGIEVCAEAANGNEALELIGRHHPDVVLLDINMPEMGGLECLGQIRSMYPRSRVVLLSIRSDTTVIDSAITLKANGYVLKDSRIDEIIESIRVVARGGTYFSQTLQPHLLTRAREPNPDMTEPFTVLSAREREVLCMIADGGSSKEIASALHVSSKTIEAHRTNLMKKLHVRKSTELVRYAIRRGLIEA